MATITNPNFSSPFTAYDKTNNPLKNFRSYSYHFVLIATDSTDFIDAAYSDDPDDARTKAVNSGEFFERPNPADPRGVISHPDLGNYIILIDTRQDTDFIIDDVEWGTTFIGNSNSGNSSVALNTFLTDGQMKIIEPYGVQFLNLISDIAAPDKLNTDPSTIPFLLKVIFVGHTDVGTVETVYDVPPFGIVFTDMTGSVDANGSVYHLKYVGAVNGAGWNAAYDGVVDGVDFHFKKGLTLDQHLAMFTEQINTKYQKDRANVVAKYKELGINLDDTCQIEWRLQALPGAKQFPLLDDFGIQVPGQTTVGDSSDTAIFKGTKEGGVAEIISKLFASSEKWTNVQLGEDSDANERNATKELFSFKVTTDWKKSSVSKGNKITITYWISEFSYTAVEVTEDNVGSGNAVPPRVNPDDVYEFDYIFTGKNIDIIRFDMNLSLGFALWMNLVTTKALPSQLSDINGSITAASTPQTRPFTQSANPQNDVRLGSPIMPPVIKAESATKEFANPDRVVGSDLVWRNFAAYQAIQSELVILGNPSLIQKIIKPNVSRPSYVKVNVKTPAKSTHKTDIWEYNEQGRNNNLSLDNYYETFWYDGYYSIITAKNKFNGGQFTQELQLIAMPEVDSAMTSGSLVPEDISNPSSTPPTQTSITPTTPSSSSVYSALDRTIDEAARDQKQP